MVVPEATPNARPSIPLWVALAGMLVALVVAIIIMATILRPLVNLVFPSQAEPPIPEGATVMEAIENPRTSTREWLYGTEQDGCAVAVFYEAEGSTCTYTPFTCVGDVLLGTDPTTGVRPDQIMNVAHCVGTQSDVINSYSWEVYIASGYASAPYTRFRLYLYRER